MSWLRPHVADEAWAAGPWCWPREADVARIIAARGPMPEPAVGSTAAVTVQHDTVVLWHVSRGHATDSVEHGPALGPALRASWRDAGLALPRGLPVLWHSMHDATSTPPSIAYMASVRNAPGVPDLHAPIDGPSFGLAFVLGLASDVLHCALPGDVIASASVDAAGHVGPVGGLEQKIAGIVRMAPHVTRLIVATSQYEEASAYARSRLRVVPVAHAAQAVEEAFGDRLSALLVDAAADPERRDALTASFFRLALLGSDALVDWAPVRRGARIALDRWTDITPDARYALSFAHAVATRHAVNAGTIAMPPAGWLTARPRMVRVHVVAHLVQQCADTATPDAHVVQHAAEALLDRAIEESSPAELRLRGALARLHTVTGRAPDALVAQEQLARAFADIYADADVAYPLSEWARLAGALRDRESLARAEAFHDRMLGSGGYRGLGPRYVELALVRGRLLLDPGDSSARDNAARMAADVTLPDHVRWSASRWAGTACRALLEQAADGGDPLASRNLTLADLDEALARADTNAAARCIDTLATQDPGPIAHLRHANASPEEVARLYPY
ncbi:MAG: hypothetical protein IT182_10660 [Acidobacteria bacterium]|nr:hypothetical protein [Acidobacteriota bacterium]